MERLLEQWRQRNPPNLLAFLTEAAQLDPSQRLDVLLMDQNERCLLGQYIPVETYLRLVRPPLDSKALVQLCCNDFVMRHKVGQSPHKRDYLERFPEYEDDLKRQFMVDEALGEGDDTPLGPPAIAQVQVPSKCSEPLETDSKNFPVIAGYEILAELGQGGAGVVYKARYVGLNRLVALKVFFPGAFGDKHKLSRFRTEGRILAQLNHPNIVQIYMIGELDGRPYLVLEFVEGQDLEKTVDRKPQPERHAAQMVNVLARTVQAAHERGIVHRDLKPQNVLVMPDGTLKLTDFDLAKDMTATRQTETGQIIGTALYMAPEQAEGRNSDVGPRTDVYALGAIFYELLTGRPPIKGETYLDTLKLVSAKDPEHPSRLVPKLSRDAETICMKCLEKKPHRRYASAGELADDLKLFLENKAIMARRPTLGGRAARCMGRHPTAVRIIGVALVLTVVGLVLDNLRIRQEQVRTEKAQVRAQATQTACLGALGLLLKQAEEERGSQERCATLQEIRRTAEEVFDQYSHDKDTKQLMARVCAALGDMYKWLGRYNEAEESIRRAVGLMEDLVNEFAEEPAYRRELADHCHRLGSLPQYADRSKGDDLRLRALTLRQKLLDQHPGERSYRLDLARSLAAKASSTRKKGRLEEAEGLYRETFNLMGDVPPGHAVPLDLAVALMNYGALQKDLGRYAKAMDAFDRARDMFRALVKSHPNRPSYIEALARLHEHRGLLLRRQRQYEDARAEHEAAALLLNNLIESFPAIPAYQLELVESRVNLSNVLQDTSRPHEAEVALRRALDLLQKLPESPTRQSRHGAVLHNLAVPLVERRALFYVSGLNQGPLTCLALELTRQDGLKEARLLLEQAVRFQRAALDAGPQNAHYRDSLCSHYVYLGKALVGLGDHEAAVATAEQLTRVPSVSTPFVYTAACLMAECVMLAKSDARLPTEKRRARAEEHARRGVDTLRQVSNDGAEGPKYTTEAKTDLGLDPLRQREDFKVLFRSGQD